MPIINWKACYETGTKVFDDEHRELVIQINSLYEAIRDKKTDEIIAEIITALISYAEKHLSHEEQVMQGLHYPGFQEHLQEHTVFRGKIAEFKSQLDRADRQLPLNLFNFLRSWLLHHIVEVDQQYGDYFADKDLG